MLEWVMKTKPNPTLLSKTSAELSPRERKLLAKIAAADPVQGCRASNRLLTKLLKIGERQVRTCLTVLREGKLITVQIKGGHERTIRLIGRTRRQ